jgi:hypothetical protein
MDLVTLIQRSRNFIENLPDDVNVDDMMDQFVLQLELEIDDEDMIFSMLPTIRRFKKDML